MTEPLQIIELVKVAIEDERTGVAFYGALAKKVKKSHLKQILSRLAEEEESRQRRFEGTLEELRRHRPREEPPSQYTPYLRTLTSERAFLDEDTALQRAKQCAGNIAPMEPASRFEGDALMLMNELRGLVPDTQSSIVNRPTREEQGPLVTLADARRKATD